MEEAGLKLIEDQIAFDLLESGKGKDLVFKVGVTTYPEVSIEGYKGIEITKKPVEVTEEDVDAELTKVQDRNSRMVTVEDRAAENGDHRGNRLRRFCRRRCFRRRQRLKTST